MTSLLRWVRVWRNLGATSDPARAYEQLVQAYSAPERSYHTLSHVAFCLRELDAARHLPERPDEVELALWLHDVVYDPRAADNEARSADFACGLAEELGLPSEVQQRCRQLILATEHATSAPGIDAQVVADVDLAILGRPAAEYDRYERRIRQEYAWVAEEDFGQGRAAILAGFLGRPTIYATTYFRAKYEASARQNLTRVLDRLS